MLSHFGRGTCSVAPHRTWIRYELHCCAFTAQPAPRFALRTCMVFWLAELADI